MSIADALRLDTIAPDEGDWPSLLALYRRAFPAWEREPEAVVAARAAAGRYRVRVARDATGAMLGFAIVDVVASLDYAVLTFLAVIPESRGQGVALRLARDAVERRSADGVSLLLTEAEAGPARLYRRAGFVPLQLDYRVPHYGDASATCSMQLLAAGPAVDQGICGDAVAAAVTHMFVTGYGVAEGDARLRGQLARIPARVVVDQRREPVESTGQRNRE